MDSAADFLSSRRDAEMAMMHTPNSDEVAEEALRESHALLQAAMDAGRLGAWEWDIRHNKVVWTERIYEFHGMQPGTFGGTVEAFTALVHPDDQAAVQSALEQALAQRAPYELEFRTARPDGELRWLCTRAEVFTDKTGAPVRLIGITQDITERKRIEEALRASEERLRVAQRYGDIGVWSWDVPSGALLLDPEMEQLYGVEQGTIRTYADWSRRVYPEDLARGEAEREAALAEHRSFHIEFRIRHTDGGERWLVSRGRGEYDPAGRLLRVLGVNIDITERKRAEEALRASEERFSKAFWASPDPLVISRASDGVIREVNESFLRLFGLRSHEVIGRQSVELGLFVDPQDRARVVRELQEGGRVRDFEVAFRQSSGQIRTGLLSVEWLDLGVERFMLTNLRDVTEWKQAEEALRESEERFRLLVQHSANVIWRAAPDGSFLERQESWERFTGQLLDGHESARDAIHPEDREAVLRAWGESLANQTPYEGEYRLRRYDGEYRHVLGRAVPLLDRRGTVREWVGYIEDVTERKRREQNAAFFAEISDDCARLSDQAEIMQTVGAKTARYLDVERVHFLEFDQTLERATVLNSGADTAPLLDRAYRLADFLTEETRAALAAGKVVAVDDTAADQRTAAFADAYRASKVRSFILAPYRSHSRLQCIFGAARPQAYRWRQDELELMRDIAARVWTRIKRARAEDALRVSEARLAAFMEHSPGSLFIKDAAGRYVVCNYAFQLQVGKTADEIIGGTDYDLFAPDLAQLFQAEDRQVASTGEAHRFEETFEHNGRRYTFLSHKFPLPDGAVGCIGTDITDQKLIEERLRHSEALQRDYAERLQQLNAASLAIHAAPTREQVLRLITEEARTLIGAHQGVISTTDRDQSQAVIEVSLSEKYARWRDYSTEPDGSGIYALVCQTNRPMRMTQAELEAHPAWKGFGAEAAGHPPMRGWLAVPLVGRDGRNIGLIQLSDKEEGEFTAADEALLQQLAQMASVALENQTLYAQEQAARAQAEEASRLKDEFLATVSHELRTPLTAFLGYAQLLQTRKRDEAYIARTVQKMVQSAKTQAQLIEDLLDVSRIVSGKLRIEPQPTELIPVVRAALDTVRTAVEAKGLQLQIDLDPQASRIIGDPNRLQQVVWNLLANATKFTPSGGTIRVSLELHGREAALTVSDTGQGISPEFLPFVFDRFRQADSTSNRLHNGLGLGLAIVRHLVELHGGRVYAASPGEGQGATFTVRLPLAGGDSPGAQADEPSDEQEIGGGCPPELRGLRVLLVDDQPDILELLHEILVPCGAVVKTCTGARDGLETLRAWRPDVLVSDIAMPNEDGYWLIRSLRSLAPEEGGATPAVALTAYVRMEDHIRVLAAGFQQYVPKPVEPLVLRTVVAHLARAASAD
jgi:PAS domain S-box-containing protein